MSYYSEESTEVTLPWLVFMDRGNNSSQNSLCFKLPPHIASSNVSSSGSVRFTPPEPYDKSKDSLNRMDERIRSNMVLTEVGPPTAELTYLEKIEHWFHLNSKHQRKKEMKARLKREAQDAAKMKREPEKSRADNDKSDQR